MARAEEIQASLAPEFPSFWKLLMRSHVSQGFRLSLPSVAAVDLEDESGEKYNTKYLADRLGLSGGWKGFSSAQKLPEGDAVVFHLVSQLNPIKFKVSKFSGSVSDIKNFNIVVNGSTINSKLLSTHVRTKYHDLCCTQKSYIHEGFLPNIDSKMGSLYRKAME